MTYEDAKKIYDDLGRRAGGKEFLKDLDIPLDVLAELFRTDKPISDTLPINNKEHDNKIIEVDFKNKKRID